MNITMLNPNCRVICLSGTMPNHIEIAKWLKTCNGKSTKYINSSWRPTELVKSVEVAEDFDEQNKFILKEARRIASEDQKMLIFVHSKIVGENICKYLKEYNVSCAFYNAGVHPKFKERMLEDFRNEYSGLSVLVCTSSLGMGVTL